MPYLRKQAVMPPSLYLCTRCKIEKPLASFAEGNTDTWCRDCHHAYHKEHYIPRPKPPKYATEEERREAVRRNNREWVRRNPDKGKVWRQAHPESQRKHKLKIRYGVTPEDVTRLLEAQSGRCGICKTDKPGGFGNQWHLDHCHDRRAIRGLLCAKCNQGLGSFKDNPQSLRAAADYLEKPCLTLGFIGTDVRRNPQFGPSTKETNPPK